MLRRAPRVFQYWRHAVAYLLLFLLAWPSRVEAYAVLSHQAIIDTVWETNLKPLLKKHYPAATEEELSGAQAYAYGGAIIQDMGYYPYGSPFFSDLTHYVRSGDFIQAMLRDAANLNEYAFALGSVAHYAADNDGHRLATNLAVPMLYPKLGKKFGDRVAYEDDPLAHVKTEFGFDVLQVARGRYAPDSYHDFIGFEVSQPLLDRAFRETYGLELKSVLPDEDKALNSYRRDVSKLIPRATRIAWSLKEDEIKGDIPDMTRRKFLYNISRSNFEKEWGKDYKRPSASDQFLAFLYRIIPKFGPLRVLQFKSPTPQAEHLFEASFNATLDRYRLLLTAEGEGRLQLRNDNLDLGEQGGPGKYRLNDMTQAKLLHKLVEQKSNAITPKIRKELLEFFSSANAPYAMRNNPKAWAEVQEDLATLRNLPVTQEEAVSGKGSY
jgi:hypothetical protein